MANTNLNDIITNGLSDIYDCGKMYNMLEKYITDIANAAYALGFQDGSHTDANVARNVSREDVSLHSKGVEATIKHLERKDFEIIDYNYEAFNLIDIVAYDTLNDSFHFVVVDVREENSSFEESKIDRATAEVDSIHYLSAHPELMEEYGVDVKVVFDVCTIIKTSDGKALLRYHIDALDEM